MLFRAAGFKSINSFQPCETMVSQYVSNQNSTSNGSFVNELNTAFAFLM